MSDIYDLIDKLPAKEAKERLGLIIDCCDNTLAALQLSLPDSIHKQGLTGAIEEIKRIVERGNP